MGRVVAADPASKTPYAFTTVKDLDSAIRSYGYIPLRATGEPMLIHNFEDGFLLDGAPLNVWIEGVWYEGQKEALAGLWSAGTVPTPGVAILNAKIVPMPPDIAANYQAYKATSGNNLLLLAAVGIAAFLFLRR